MRLKCGLTLELRARCGDMVLVRHWRITDGWEWVDRRGLD